MSNHPFADKLIVGVDDKFQDIKTPHQTYEHARRLLSDVCEELEGTGVQLKINAVARLLGTYHCLQTIQEAGLTVMVDWKLVDVVDTMLADIRSIRHFGCVRRLTFRVEAHSDFLFGKGENDGAVTIMPDVSFLPVGPLTDNDDAYFAARGLNDRAEGVRIFGEQVGLFGNVVHEVIMSPKDIRHLPDGFMHTHSPVTPAVRPAGLKGNERNDANALNVEEAFRAGSSAIIVASPIMGATNRRVATFSVFDQIGEVLDTM